MKIITEYLRPRKAALLRERYNLYDHPVAPRITDVENGVIIPAYTDPHGQVISGVVDAEGCFVADSHEADFPKEVEEKAKTFQFKYVDEEVVYLGLFNPHWGHFITDCLANFWCLERFSDLRFVFSYFPGEEPRLHPNIQSALALLGVSRRIEFVSEPRRYRRIYVPRKGMIPRQYALPECGQVFETIINNALKKANPPSGGCEKILLSRSHFPKAKLNELGVNEVEKVFTDNGYRAICPEKMSPEELIGCLANARDVVAICGTPAHNMLFAPCGAKLTVIEKYANINNYQQGIDRLKQLEATYIDADYFIWSIDPGLGPFIMGDTPEFRRFAADNNLRYNIPAMRPRRVLSKYFKLYYRHYKRRWIMPQWLEPEVGLMSEAYQASEDIFGRWLDGTKSIFLSDSLSPRMIAKRLIQLLRR